jgi:putative phosphoribosyl transferase
MRFRNRTDAGRRLAKRLQTRELDAPLVIALPRGGVPVAYEIARALRAPLDVLIARKLGAPGHPELAIGAIAEGGGMYLNADLAEHLGVGESYVREVTHSELAEIERRRAAYRGSKPLTPVHARTVILVDDGLATGATMIAAVRAIRKLEPRAIVVAVPTCAPDVATLLAGEAVDVVCAMTPRNFQSVGIWYDDFDQTSDAEVIELLRRAEADLPSRRDQSPESDGRVQ